MTTEPHSLPDGDAVLFPETAYGIVKRLRTIERWAALVAQWRATQALSILDYGCGTGDHVTYPLACLGHHVLGVDYHAASIEEAGRRFRAPNLSFRLADIDQLVREGAVFDLVICSEVLEHLHEPLLFLRQVSQMVVKHGGLIITTPNGYGSFEWLCSLERVLDRIGMNRLLRKARRALRVGAADEQILDERRPDVPSTIGFLNMDSKHVQFFGLAELESLFARGGFRIAERQARTLLCGPYADTVFHLLTWKQDLYRLNNEAADRLPMTWAADWMYLLEPNGTIVT
jgi:SAM-dependent methyltransferase